jgi:hypothetical protein
MVVAYHVKAAKTHKRLGDLSRYGAQERGMKRRE